MSDQALGEAKKSGSKRAVWDDDELQHQTPEGATLQVPNAGYTKKRRGSLDEHEHHRSKKGEEWEKEEITKEKWKKEREELRNEIDRLTKLVQDQKTEIFLLRKKLNSDDVNDLNKVEVSETEAQNVGQNTEEKESKSESKMATCETMKEDNEQVTVDEEKKEMKQDKLNILHKYNESIDETCSLSSIRF